LNILQGEVLLLVYGAYESQECWKLTVTRTTNPFVRLFSHLNIQLLR